MSYTIFITKKSYLLQRFPNQNSRNMSLPRNITQTSTPSTSDIVDFDFSSLISNDTVFFQHWTKWLLMSQQNFTNHMELLEVQNGSFGTVTQVLLDEYLKRQLGKGFWYTALFLTSYFSYSIKTNVSINFVSLLQ